jgi:hypothetical protein
MADVLLSVNLLPLYCIFPAHHLQQHATLLEVLKRHARKNRASASPLALSTYCPIC